LCEGYLTEAAEEEESRQQEEEEVESEGLAGVDATGVVLAGFSSSDDSESESESDSEEEKEKANKAVEEELRDQNAKLAEATKQADEAREKIASLQKQMDDNKVSIEERDALKKKLTSLMSGGGGNEDDAATQQELKELRTKVFELAKQVEELRKMVNKAEKGAAESSVDRNFAASLASPRGGNTSMLADLLKKDQEDLKKGVGDVTPRTPVTPRE